MEKHVAVFVVLAVCFFVAREVYRKKISSWRTLAGSGVYVDHYFDDTAIYTYFDRSEGVEKKISSPSDMLFLKCDLMAIRRSGIVPCIRHFGRDGRELEVTKEVQKRFAAYDVVLVRALCRAGGRSRRLPSLLAESAPYLFWREIYFAPELAPKPKLSHVG